MQAPRSCSLEQQLQQAPALVQMGLRWLSKLRQSGLLLPPHKTEAATEAVTEAATEAATEAVRKCPLTVLASLTWASGSTLVDHPLPAAWLEQGLKQLEPLQQRQEPLWQQAQLQGQLPRQLPLLVLAPPALVSA